MAIPGGIGALRHVVEVQEDKSLLEPGKGRNEYNEQPPRWETVAMRNAALMPLSASEQLAANQVQGFRTLKLRMRAFRGLSSGRHRIRFGQRLLNIEEVLNADELNEYQEIRVVEKT